MSQIIRFVLVLCGVAMSQTCDTVTLLSIFANTLDALKTVRSTQGLPQVFSLNVDEAVHALEESQCAPSIIPVVLEETEQHHGGDLWSIINTIYTIVTRVGKWTNISLWNLGDFPETFEMSRLDRAHYAIASTGLGRLLGFVRTDHRMSPQELASIIQFVVKMRDLVKNRAINFLTPDVKKFVIPDDNKLPSLFEVFTRKTKKQRLLLMVPAAQTFLDALSALGGGSWGLHSTEDSSSNFGSKIFLDSSTKTFYFPPPECPITSSYVSDLKFLAEWMFDEIVETQYPCRGFMHLFAPVSWCTPDPFRLAAVHTNMEHFAEYVDNLPETDGILAWMPPATYAILSALLDNMRVNLGNWTNWRQRQMVYNKPEPTRNIQNGRNDNKIYPV